MMKITYTISQPVNIDPSSIISKINDELVELRYNVIYKDNYTIRFNDPFWTIGARADVFKKVDGGKFQIITSEKESRLNFSYYVSFDQIIFFAIFFIFFSVVVDYHIIYLLIVFTLIFLLRIDNVKSLGREIMNNIITRLA